MQTLERTRTPHRITFGLFEADLHSGELRKAGQRVKLQGLPFKVLTILVENPGIVVTREELQSRVWGPDVVVDFEHSLSNAIKKVREALGDSADNPRFIETLSRRGFRFIAPVGFPDASPADTPAAAIVGAPASADVPPAGVRVDLPQVRGGSRYLWLAGTAAVGLGGILLGGLIRFVSLSPAPASPSRVVAVTKDGSIYAPKDNLLGSRSTFVTDGAHLFTPVNENGRITLSQISVSTGATQVVPLPSRIRQPEAEDISPDGTRLLVRSNLASSVQQPLWIVNPDGGSAFRVSDILIQDAIWMPDGKGILYTSGNQISVISPEGGRSNVLATVAHRAFWPRWSPDGKLLRFTMIDPVSHTSSLWQLPEGQHAPQIILQSSDISVRECCGIWTADGKYFVYEQTKDGTTDLWRVDAALDSRPVRVTNGPLNSMSPSPGRKGEQIFFVGQDVHSQLERFDSERKEYRAQQGFLASAERIRFSRDGLWVAWVDAEHHLWKARTDGSDMVLLTPPSLRVFVANWSPDDTRLALMAREQGEPWQIYSVSADGGPPERLVQQNRNVGDPSFSADGKYLVFGTVAELMGEVKSPRSLSILDLATHGVSELAHSEGLFSPVWSPDGRYIAAITVDQNRLMLYDTKAALWKELAVTSASWPVWSRDSKAVYIHAYQAEGEPILQVSVPDGKVKSIADLTNFRAGSIAHAAFAGMTVDGLPLMHAEIASGNLYSLDFGAK